MKLSVLEESLSRPPIAEGKTKRIFEVCSDPNRVFLMAKKDITAGDGAKHDIIEGKPLFANQTTCNVFRLLKSCGIPVAFEKQLSPLPWNTPETYIHGFEAQKCTMLPYEVVVRREAHGSYLKRAPHLMKGHIFPRLVLEFFLKTNGKKWKTYNLICDDPYMIHDDDSESVNLYDPKQPSLVQNPASSFLTLSEREVFTQENEGVLLEEIGNIARRTFLVLEKAWQQQGRKLVDFKVEFGIASSGELLLADVIDNDSWRVVDESGGYIDKQVYRDGGDLDTVTAKYKQVADLTNQFTLPHQRLIFWCGSDKDDLGQLIGPLSKLLPVYKLEVLPITCSVHKQPALAYTTLQKCLQEVPDTVIIALIGRSNGAGPTLSANSTVPVITVPLDYKDFPDDIWSSLRTPSYVPVMTVLEPANAVHAALQILAMRNPQIYATLRFGQEARLTNM